MTKSIQACKHVCQLMHKHVQERCQLTELVRSLIFTQQLHDFLMPKAILPRRVLSMEACLGPLLLHLLLCCCWLLLLLPQHLSSVMLWLRPQQLSGIPPACKVNPETHNSRRSLLGRRHTSSAFSNIINMKQEIANLLCFIFTCVHACSTNHLWQPDESQEHQGQPH